VLLALTVRPDSTTACSAPRFARLVAGTGGPVAVFGFVALRVAAARVVVLAFSTIPARLAVAAIALNGNAGLSGETGRAR